MTTCETTQTIDRDALLLEHAKLVRYIAERMAVMLPSHLEVQDLIQDGTVGLMEAIDRYDERRGVKFKTFAATRIRGSILDGLRQHDWVSRGGRRRVREMNRAEEELSQQLKRTPTEGELSQHTSLPVEEIQRRRRENREGVVLSLDELARLSAMNGSDETLGTNLPDMETNVERTVAQKEMHQKLVVALKHLDEREQMVLQLYYNEELGVKDIASLLGVSNARVSQLHTRALGKVRNSLREVGYARAS